MSFWQRLSQHEQRMLIALLLAAVAVRIYFIGHFNINWDEFYYLSQVYDHLRGDLDRKLQTFHVHFFGWLSAVSENEADQIVAARAVMLGLHLLTGWFLYRIARRLAGARAALFAVVAYLSVSYVIRGAASFRTDPIAVCMVMAAFDLVLVRTASAARSVAAGLLIALAAMITIKTAVFLPSLLLILGWPILAGPSRAGAARAAAIAAFSAMAGFALLYILHAQTFDAAITKSSTGIATDSLAKTIVDVSLFPQPGIFKYSVKMDLVYWAFGLVGACVLAQRLWQGSRSTRLQWIETTALALPVASIAIYRNSFPYFYPFVLAPASVLLALAWQALIEQTEPQTGRSLPHVLKLLALAWFAVSLILHGVYVPATTPLQHQRAVLAVVHEAFPTPVAYLDRCSMVSGFPQVGFFMSTWGIENYLARGEPVLQQAIERDQPPLMIAAHPLLDVANAVHPTAFLYRPQLLDGDREALQQTYIHHWGPIYVAGKQIEALPAGGPPVSIELAIAGRYTLEADAPARIDGRLVSPGETLELTSGSHWISADAPAGVLVLRWGDRLYRPAEPAPSRHLFLGFYAARITLTASGSGRDRFEADHPDPLLQRSRHAA